MAFDFDFVWEASGNPINYTNWNWGQPSDSLTLGCLTMLGANGRWVNDECASPHGPTYCEVVFYC